MRIEIESELLEDLKHSDQRHRECYVDGDEKAGMHYARNFDVCLDKLYRILALAKEQERNG